MPSYRFVARAAGQTALQILEKVQACPGSTAAELAGGDVRLRYEYARLLGALEDQHAVVAGPRRRCRENLREERTWFLVEPLNYAAAAFEPEPARAEESKGPWVPADPWARRKDLE